MIQCSYQITQFLFAINRQEGEREREKKGMQFSLVKEKERNLLVNQTVKKKNNIPLSGSLLIEGIISNRKYLYKESFFV